MIRFEYPLQLDLSGDFQGAADAYEEFLEVDRGFVEPYVNLAVLYWVCLDPGMSGVSQFESGFLERAGKRYVELIECAGKRFSEDGEPEFWELYTSHITLGEPGFVEECKSIVSRCASIVPYFYLLSATSDVRYIKPARRLLEKCERLPSAKNRYILSVLRATFQRLDEGE